MEFLLCAACQERVCEAELSQQCKSVCAALQVMKMMMPLLSSAAGQLHFQLPESSVLNPMDLIASLDLDDPDSVTKAEPFEGAFPEMGPPPVYSIGVDHRFKQSFYDARMILAGTGSVYIPCINLMVSWVHAERA